MRDLFITNLFYPMQAPTNNEQRPTKSYVWQLRIRVVTVGFAVRRHIESRYGYHQTKPNDLVRKDNHFITRHDQKEKFLQYDWTSTIFLCLYIYREKKVSNIKHLMILIIPSQLLCFLWNNIIRRRYFSFWYSFLIVAFSLLLLHLWSEHATMILYRAPIINTYCWLQTETIIKMMRM